MVGVGAVEGLAGGGPLEEPLAVPAVGDPTERGTADMVDHLGDRCGQPDVAEAIGAACLGRDHEQPIESVVAVGGDDRLGRGVLDLRQPAQIVPDQDLARACG